jgi:hypothetical protein
MILLAALALQIQAPLVAPPADETCLINFDVPCLTVGPQFPTHPMHIRVPPEGVTVRVSFNVLEGGVTQVTGSTAPEGFAMFKRTSERAVSQWLYAPGHPRQGAETTLVYRMED